MHYYILYKCTFNLKKNIFLWDSFFYFVFLLVFSDLPFNVDKLLQDIKYIWRNLHPKNKCTRQQFTFSLQ